MDMLLHAGLSVDELLVQTAALRQKFIDDYSYKTPADIHNVACELGASFQGTSSYHSDLIEVYGPGQFVIILLDWNLHVQDRYPVAKALGHYFFHSKEGLIPGKVASSPSSKQLAWEAHGFATNLLMPEDEFRECWERTTSYKEVADYFRLPTEPVWYRARALELNTLVTITKERT